MSEELEIAIEAAKKGANEALKFYEKNVTATIKDDATIVTQADYASEKAIISHLQSKIPNCNILAEESGGAIHKDGFWTIDPVDGTRSFSRGVPTWAVLISYCKNEDVQIGVCYFPIMKELLYAERGYGAYLNDKKIHVSDVKNLKKAYVSFGSPRHFKNKKPLLNLIDKSGSTRSPDSTYADLLVAKGAMDVNIDAFGKIWDLAPFKVIAEEAGGKITRIDGSLWKYDGEGCIMTNGYLHNEVLEIINHK